MNLHDMKDPYTIEFWENEYLEQINHMLNLEKEKMMAGFLTKEDIRDDWQGYLGKDTSDFAVGSERIFYWLFNQFGQPNSSPIGSDMFFETYNAYVHIDIKTVTTDNLGDFNKTIFVGDNQNSYQGEIEVRGKGNRIYKGNLPPVYHKKDGTEKICLTYFICILYNKEGNIQMINLACMPNGLLNSVYGNVPLAAGKNPGKVRFNYTKCNEFLLLKNKKRLKMILWNENMEKSIEDGLSLLKSKVDLSNVIRTESKKI